MTKQNTIIFFFTTTLRLVLEGLGTSSQERLYRTLVTMHIQTMTTEKTTYTNLRYKSLNIVILYSQCPPFTGYGGPEVHTSSFRAFCDSRVLLQFKQPSTIQTNLWRFEPSTIMGQTIRRAFEVEEVDHSGKFKGQREMCTSLQ